MHNVRWLDIQYYQSCLSHKNHQIFCLLTQMFPLPYEYSFSAVVKMYVFTFVLALAVYFPFAAYLQISSRGEELHKFYTQVSARNSGQPMQTQQQQLGFHSLVSLLQQSSFAGPWVNSIKQSRLLTAENGTFELKAQSTANDEFSLQMLVYDGKYSEDCLYQINIDSSAIKTRQKISSSNYLIYETINPIIALQTKNCMFRSWNEKPLYVNKIKLRVSFDTQQDPQKPRNLRIRPSPNSIILEILLAAEYDINIIASGIKQSPIVLKQLLFASLVLVQVIVQATGAYLLYDQCLLHSQIISPYLIKLQIAGDYLQFVALCFMFVTYKEKRMFLTLPIAGLFVYIFMMQKKLIELVTHQSRSANQVYPSANSANAVIGLSSCIIFYAFNLNGFLFLIYAMFYLVPQLVKNFSVGGKIHYSLQNFAMYTIPKFLLLYYLKIYSGNIFRLEPSLVLFLLCGVIVGIQFLVMGLQQKYGSRAILPQFLIPKSLASRFKFFVIPPETDDKVCSICLSDLAAPPPEISGPITGPQLEETEGSNNFHKYTDFYVEFSKNKVVVTPCKHQFHYPCLAEWTQNKLQCPNCRTKIPPFEEDQ